MLSGVCEDIGRHMALEKLLGYRSQQNWPQGAVLVSSCASYEIVQKNAMFGIEILFAVSAATSLAVVVVAEKSNLTLVGFSKPGRAIVYTHPQRLSAEWLSSVQQNISSKPIAKQYSSKYLHHHYSPKLKLVFPLFAYHSSVLSKIILRLSSNMMMSSVAIISIQWCGSIGVLIFFQKPIVLWPP